MKLETVKNPVEDLTDFIEQVIRSRTSGAIRNLQVSVNRNNQIVLSGRTSTYYAKQLASHAAMNAAKENEISNGIEVF